MKVSKYKFVKKPVKEKMSAEHSMIRTGEHLGKVVEKNSDFFFPSVLDGISLFITVGREIHVEQKSI